MGNCVFAPKNGAVHTPILPLQTQAPINTSSLPMVGPLKENIKPEIPNQLNTVRTSQLNQQQSSMLKSPQQNTSIVLHGSKLLRERNTQVSEIAARVNPGTYVNGKVMDIRPTFDTVSKI
jgi:hypothetical protein